MKKFIIDDAFWDLFPQMTSGVLVIEKVKEKDTLTDQQLQEIQKILEDANNEAKKYLTSDVISENEVVRQWREAYQKFPTKKGARCSIEALLKRVLHGNPVETISPSVDITNSISLKYAFPIGTENIEAFVGDLHLGRMKGGEDFIPLGTDQQDPPIKDEIAFFDQAGAVCRCWDWRDGVRTAVDDNTPRQFIIMDCLDPKRLPELEQALDELSALLIKYLGVKIYTRGLISITNKEIVIED